MTAVVSPIIDSTPVELHSLSTGDVWVKREDLCCRPPGPPFSKMRGLYLRIKALKDAGVSTVGYVDTTVSMAGCGISYCTSLLGMKAIIYQPVRKDGVLRDLLPVHTRIWEQNGAEVRRVSPTRLSILWRMVCKKFEQEFPVASKMLELHLLSENAISENAKEWQRTDVSRFRTVVVNVGSGTILAGLLRGAVGSSASFVGVTCCDKDLPRLESDIRAKARVPIGGFFGPRLRLVNTGYGYTDASAVPCPFPSHAYYDLKAWEWLVANFDSLEKPVLFWNIGAGLPVG